MTEEEPYYAQLESAKREELIAEILKLNRRCFDLNERCFDFGRQIKTLKQAAVDLDITWRKKYMRLINQGEHGDYFDEDLNRFRRVLGIWEGYEDALGDEEE